MSRCLIDLSIEYAREANKLRKFAKVRAGGAERKHILPQERKYLRAHPDIDTWFILFTGAKNTLSHHESENVVVVEKPD